MEIACSARKTRGEFLTRDASLEAMGSVTAAGIRVPVGLLWGRLGLLATASLVIGGLESWAQGFLPHSLAPLSNSVSGWTLVTALLLGGLRLPPRWAAAGGALSFVLLVVGYAAVSTWRGHYYSPLLWGALGLLAGPFVGVAVTWLRDRGVRSALGAGLLSGIALGDAYHGLTVIADTTGVTYWIIIGTAGVLLAAVVAVRRVRRIRLVALMVALALLIAAGMVLAFGLF